jgi:hypothetical protein
MYERMVWLSYDVCDRGSHRLAPSTLLSQESRTVTLMCFPKRYSDRYQAMVDQHTESHGHLCSIVHDEKMWCFVSICHNLILSTTFRFTLLNYFHFKHLSVNKKVYIRITDWAWHLVPVPGHVVDLSSRWPDLGIPRWICPNTSRTDTHSDRKSPASHIGHHVAASVNKINNI